MVSGKSHREVTKERKRGAAPRLRSKVSLDVLNNYVLIMTW